MRHGWNYLETFFSCCELATQIPDLSFPRKRESSFSYHRDTEDTEILLLLFRALRASVVKHS